MRTRSLQKMAVARDNRSKRSTSLPAMKQVSLVKNERTKVRSGEA